MGRTKWRDPSAMAEAEPVAANADDAAPTATFRKRKWKRPEHEPRTSLAETILGNEGDKQLQQLSETSAALENVLKVLVLHVDRINCEVKRIDQSFEERMTSFEEQMTNLAHNIQGFGDTEEALANEEEEREDVRRQTISTPGGTIHTLSRPATAQLAMMKENESDAEEEPDDLEPNLKNPTPPVKLDDAMGAAAPASPAAGSSSSSRVPSRPSSRGRVAAVRPEPVELTPALQALQNATHEINWLQDELHARSSELHDALQLAQTQAEAVSKRTSAKQQSLEEQQKMSSDAEAEVKRIERELESLRQAAVAEQANQTNQFEAKKDELNARAAESQAVAERAAAAEAAACAAADAAAGAAEEAAAEANAAGGDAQSRSAAEAAARAAADAYASLEADAVAATNKTKAAAAQAAADTLAARAKLDEALARDEKEQVSLCRLVASFCID